MPRRLLYDDTLSPIVDSPSSATAYSSAMVVLKPRTCAHLLRIALPHPFLLFHHQRMPPALMLSFISTAHDAQHAAKPPPNDAPSSIGPSPAAATSLAVIEGPLLTGMNIVATCSARGSYSCRR